MNNKKNNGLMKCGKIRNERQNIYLICKNSFFFVKYVTYCHGYRQK